ncbi:MAG: FecR domain-containing protein [Spirochaetes bacterium]|nr:FecR domain-containing protein [Spirochaetota bacterium]
MNSSAMKKICTFASCLALAAAGSALLSCKKESPPQAIATFVVGNVKLVRTGEADRQLKHRDILKKTDTIVTSAKSFCAFQLGEEAVMKLSENSTMRLQDILESGKNRVYLEQGRVFAAVRKMGKGTSYEVQTKTTVAAVRGTQFSVNYQKGASVVAVNEGAVKVQRMSEEAAVAEEQLVEQGKAAVVTKNDSTTRELNRDEVQRFAEDTKVIIVEDVQEKTESDLRKIEAEALQGKQAAVEKDSGESEAAPAEQGETKQVVAEEKREQPKQDAKGAILIWTSKRVYKTDDTIVVGYKNMPDSRTAWISVAKAGSSGNDFIHYDWTNSKTEGQMVFEGLGLQPGNYEVHAHFSRSRSIDKRFPFRVE